MATRPWHIYTIKDDKTDAFLGTLSFQAVPTVGMLVGFVSDTATLYRITRVVEDDGECYVEHLHPAPLTWGTSPLQSAWDAFWRLFQGGIHG